MRDVPYTMLELGFYENFKSVIRKLKNTEQLTQQDELAAAAVTGGNNGPSLNTYICISFHTCMMYISLTMIINLCLAFFLH